jgi:transcription factor-like protein
MTEEDALRLTLPARDELDHLMYLYFDVCIATYRIVHRPSAEAWLRIVEANVRQGRPAWHEIGRARASIVLACLAVATAHNEKSRGTTAADDVARALARSDRLFCVAAHLTDAETGAPRLESAQTRIVQTLYLLTTSRMNRAWYTFGSALQLISALGLHRRTARKRYLAQGTVDYIQAQFRMRTFWTAYVLDKYLGVIFGRPRHYHDDDIDQDMPDRFEDDEMTPQGPVAGFDEQLGCHIDALIFHAKDVLSFLALQDPLLTLIQNRPHHGPDLS